MPPRDGQSASMIVEVVVGIEAFRSLKEDWERLYAADSNGSPFRSWRWIESWIESYGKGREFLTVVCYRGYEIVGIVPLTWQVRNSPLEIRKLWMLGFHSWVGSNGLTEEPIFAIEADPKTREQVWNVVHEKLRALVNSGKWDSVAYRRFGSGIEGCSVVEVKDQNNEIRNYHRGCEYIELPRSWDEYLKGISKSMRENIPYYRKKFKKEGIDYSVSEVARVNLVHTIDTLVNLHKRRTYTDPSHLHVDYFRDRRQQVLLKDAVLKMVRTGEAKVYTLTANGQVIAAQVFLQNDHQLLAHYSGFDPDWARFSPLFVLQSEVIKDAIAEGFKTINLLRGNASWQRRWGANSSNQIVDVTICRRGFVSRLRQAIGYQESLVIDHVSNSLKMRKLRASFRTWQLQRKSA